MLNALREGAKSGLSKFILFGFMTFAVGGLIMMDMGGFFRSGGIRADNVVKIDGEEISIRHFDNTVGRVLSQQGIDPQTAYRLGLINQILESEIAGNLLYRAAYDDGMRVSDELIAQQVKTIVAPYVSDQLNAKEALRRILMSQNMSEGQFISALRQEITTTLLRSSMQASVAFTPEREARDLYRYQNEERTIKAIIFPNKTIKDYQEPTDEILLPFYQAGIERYAIPETRSFTMAVLTQENLEKTMDISDEELKAIYERDIDAYTLPERRTMEQAVFIDEKTADAIAKDIQKGSSLKNAVKNETGNADAYLGKDDFQKDGLVEAISKKAFAADKGDMIGPIETALGWHVLVVKDILPVKVQPFSKIKKDLRKEELQYRLADQLFATAGMIDDQLAGGAALEDVVESMDLKVKTFGPVREDGSTVDNKDGMKGFEEDSVDIIETAFALVEGESSPVMELDDGSFAVVRVDSIIIKSYKPFEDIKADLRDVWIKDQQQVLNKQRAQDSLRALANNEKNMTQVAKDHKLKIKTIKLKRSDKAPDPLSGPAKTKFFEIKKDGFAVATAKDGFVLGTIHDIKLPDGKKIKEKDLAETIETASKGTAGEVFLSYLHNLRSKYDVKVNDDLLQATYGSGAEQPLY